MDSKLTFDRHAQRILAVLQTEARISTAELGRRIGLSPTAVADRIQDLENSGVIRSYVALVDPAKVGLPLVVLITMSCDGEMCRKVVNEIGNFPEVVECYA